VPKEVIAMTEQNITYTTGEVAELCGTTTRTVQYYDQKKLLAPTDYSEGGRRLYSSEDAKRLQFILLLKSMGLSLAQIRGILDSPNRNTVLALLLDEQTERLEQDVAEAQEKLSAIKTAKADIALHGHLTIKTNAAMAAQMSDNKAWKQWMTKAIVCGVFFDVLWIGTLVLGIVTGIWWPFPLALIIVACAVSAMVAYYSKRATYTCPACSAEFRPKYAQFFFAGHTLHTRKLTCPKCHQKDWCVEHYHEHPSGLEPGQYKQVNVV
jgi:DNA-binding transcriptional MerR regulator